MNCRNLCSNGIFSFMVMLEDNIVYLSQTRIILSTLVILNVDIPLSLSLGFYLLFLLCKFLSSNVCRYFYHNFALFGVVYSSFHRLSRLLSYSSPLSYKREYITSL